jgi:molecular chaperone GrpE
MMWRPRKTATPDDDATKDDGHPDLADLGDPPRLLERLTLVERRQAEFAAAVDALVQAVSDAAAGHRRALAALHRDLVGEQKTATAHGVFLAVVPALDSLSELCQGLGSGSSRQVRSQVDAVTSVLGNVLQALGYDTFDVQVGDAFEPERMECMGYTEGAPGRVLAVVRPGYAFGNRVARPAGVLIAAPADSNASANGGDSP